MPNCPSCNAELPAGARWCGICHSYASSPDVGRLASPGKRLGAYVLDGIIPVIALFLFFVVAGIGAGSATEGSVGPGALLGAMLLLAYLLWALVLFARGTTPGKTLLHMRVIKEDGSRAGFLTMLLREWVGKTISAAVLSLGFLWILIDKEHQGWHDKLMSTFVVEAQQQIAT